jgi:hypothetical protein
MEVEVALTAMLENVYSDITNLRREYKWNTKMDSKDYN